MAKRIEPEKKQRAERVAELYADAFVEQFNRYFGPELPTPFMQDIGPFSASGDTTLQGTAHFMKALKAHRNLSPEERETLHERATGMPSPSTIIAQQRPKDAAWRKFDALPEADKNLFLEVYGKQPVPIHTTRRLIDDLPGAMQHFVQHEVRDAEHTHRLIEAAKQKLSGRIDDEIYERTVHVHADTLRQCDTLKKDLLSQRFKEQLLVRTLEQLPEMMLEHDPALMPSKAFVGENGKIHR